MHILSYLKGSDVAFADTLEKPEFYSDEMTSVAKNSDAPGIAKLLNECFERGRAKTNVTAEWVISTFHENAAVWIVAKDRGGTVRGCIASFRIVAPYPNSLKSCSSPWGLVDWFCVHPLWRGKKVGSNLLQLLDYITYRIGRKASVFLKEGMPLQQLPAYVTFLLCRRAGNPSVKRVREGTGIVTHDYHSVERDTGLPLLRVEGIRSGDSDIQEWEDTLDKELPPCWVFVTSVDKIDTGRGWKIDSLVSMYAFRWIPGKWLGSVPNIAIL